MTEGDRQRLRKIIERQRESKDRACSLLDPSPPHTDGEAIQQLSDAYNRLERDIRQAFLEESVAEPEGER